jgi:hypothetical protein
MRASHTTILRRRGEIAIESSPSRLPREPGDGKRFCHASGTTYPRRLRPAVILIFVVAVACVIIWNGDDFPQRRASVIATDIASHIFP